MKIKNPHNIKRKGETILSCDDGTNINAHIVRIGPAHASRIHVTMNLEKLGKVKSSQKK